MTNGDRPRRIRFRLGTLLLVVAVVALLLVVIIQQVQIRRLRRTIDAQEKERARLTDIVGAVRDFLERAR